MPRLPGDDASAERAAVLITNIHVLVHKHAEPIIRARAKDQIEAFIADRSALREALRETVQSVIDGGGTLADVREAVTEARRIYTNPDAIVMMTTVQVVPYIVGAWVQSVMVRVRPGKGLALLRAEQLDDAMLPAGEDVNEYFDQFFAETPIEGELAREVLRSVKESLPDGKRLPPDLVEFFGLRKIYVVSP